MNLTDEEMMELKRVMNQQEQAARIDAYILKLNTMFTEIQIEGEI